MMPMKTFAGGLHPPELKRTSQEAIIDLPAPERVVLPVAQHIGAPAKPIVKIGDSVVRGQVIAEPGGFVSAPVHATISGKVKAVGNFMHPFGSMSPAIVIERSADEPEPDYPSEDALSLDGEEIKNRIKAAGLVGLGGATFPTHVKLSPPPAKPIHTVILNGVECEPALTSDHRLMLEEPDKIISGLKLIMKSLGAEKGYIGIESNKPDAIEKLDKALKGESNIDVVPLQVKYPQGGEKQLIAAVLNCEVPSGGLPMDVGVVVQNVATAAAVHEAVSQKKPLMERVVTLAGPCAKKPGNYRVRMGTLIEDFIAMAGGLKESPALKKVIMGGPMMGFAMFDLKVPLLKGTSGLLLWDESMAQLREESPCIRCGRCIAACPMNLMPQQLKVMIDANEWEKAAELGALDCMECGCCAYTCPSNLPLVQTLKLGKRIIMTERKRAAEKASATKGK